MLIAAFVSLFQVVLTHELFLQHFNLKTHPAFISSMQHEQSIGEKNASFKPPPDSASVPFSH
jgi:hypothetical protein